ncbi:hypothetical protein [Mesorhizobium amorphae]
MQSYEWKGSDVTENLGGFETLTAYTAGLLNRIYFREFDINSVDEVLRRIEAVDVADLYESPDLLFDLVSLPYAIEINLVTYRRWSTAAEGEVDTTIEAISEMAGKLHHMIGAKVRAIK